MTYKTLPAIEHIKILTENLEQANKELTKQLDHTEIHQGMTEKAVAFFHLKSAYEALDKARKVTYAVKDRWDKLVIPATIEESGLDLIRVPEIARSFSPQTKTSASIIPDRRDDAYGWLRDNGGSELIVETVNSSSLASFVKEKMLEEGIEPPEDLIRVNTYNTTGVNKYTPKKT